MEEQDFIKEEQEKKVSEYYNIVYSITYSYLSFVDPDTIDGNVVIKNSQFIAETKEEITKWINENVSSNIVNLQIQPVYKLINDIEIDTDN